MAALRAQCPCDSGTDGEGCQGKQCGQTQRGEAGAGEVEERGHGEGVVADAAMGEEVVNVGERGEVARGPEAEGQGCGDGDAEERESGVGEGDPAVGGFGFGVGAGAGDLGTREGRGDQHQQRKIRGEGVVLLVGGEREEGKHQEGEDAEQQGGALGGGEVGEGLGMARVPGACPAIAVRAPGGQAGQRKRDQEAFERAGYGDGEEEEGAENPGSREVEAVGVDQAVATPAAYGVGQEDGHEQAPGEEPDEVEAPVEIAGELVVVARDAAAEEAEDVLVDEVEPEEAVAAHAAGVAEAGEDVPGRGDGEQEQGAAEWAQTAPVAGFAGECKVGDGRTGEEDDGDEALGEDGEGERGPECVRVEGC